MAKTPPPSDGIPDDALTLAEALLHLRRFVTCSVAVEDSHVVFDRLVAQGHATAEGSKIMPSVVTPPMVEWKAYRITASGDRLGKAVLRHVQACTGAMDRARPDGCFERLCCPRCGEETP